MKDEMDRYYDLRAPEYEQIYYRDIPERRAELDFAAESLKKLADGQRVLDLACGTGYWSKVASQTAAEVVALDKSMPMIKEARQKQYGCPVRIHQADLYSHGIEPDQFDLVLLCFWFSHHSKADFRRLFETVFSPAKQTGRIWLIDNNPPAEGSENISARVDEHGDNYKRRYLDDGSEFIILKNYYSADELKAIFGRYATIEELRYGHYYWTAELRSLK